MGSRVGLYCTSASPPAPKPNYSGHRCPVSQWGLPGEDPAETDFCRQCASRELPSTLNHTFLRIHHVWFSISSATCSWMSFMYRATFHSIFLSQASSCCEQLGVVYSDGSKTHLLSRTFQEMPCLSFVVVRFFFWRSKTGTPRLHLLLQRRPLSGTGRSCHPLCGLKLGL